MNDRLNVLFFSGLMPLGWWRPPRPIILRQVDRESMLSGIRSIFYQTTLKWPPFEEYGIGKAVIRGLYNKMLEPGGYHYENLDLQADSPTLSSRRRNGHSVCKFCPDSLVIEEKSPEIAVTIEGFIEAVQTVLGGLGQEDMPPFFLQHCKLQCLAQPANVEDSLELLARRVANVYEPIAPFQRPPTHFGVRFRFPPVILKRIEETEDAPPSKGGDQAMETGNMQIPEVQVGGATEKRIESYVTARFETFAEDIQQVWMEVMQHIPSSNGRFF